MSDRLLLLFAAETKRTQTIQNCGWSAWRWLDRLTSELRVIEPTPLPMRWAIATATTRRMDDGVADAEISDSQSGPGSTKSADTATVISALRDLANHKTYSDVSRRTGIGMRKLRRIVKYAKSGNLGSSIELSTDLGIMGRFAQGQDVHEVILRMPEEPPEYIAFLWENRNRAKMNWRGDRPQSRFDQFAQQLAHEIGKIPVKKSRPRKQAPRPGIEEQKRKTAARTAERDRARRARRLADQSVPKPPKPSAEDKLAIANQKRWFRRLQQRDSEIARLTVRYANALYIHEILSRDSEITTKDLAKKVRWRGMSKADVYRVRAIASQINAANEMLANGSTIWQTKSQTNSPRGILELLFLRLCKTEVLPNRPPDFEHPDVEKSVLLDPQLLLVEKAEILRTPTGMIRQKCKDLRRC